MGSSQPHPAQDKDVYAVFCGEINAATVDRIVTVTSALHNNKARQIHLLFQSGGGYAGDGFLLYRHFASLPNLTLYNAGFVASVGVTAYLGARIRKTSARAVFMIHQPVTPAKAANPIQLKSATELLELDVSRNVSLLREYLTLDEKQWAEVGMRDVHFSGEQAVKIGLAHELGEFSPDPSGPILHI